MYQVKNGEKFLTGKKKVETATTVNRDEAKTYLTEGAAKMQAGWANKNIGSGWQVFSPR